MLAHHRSGSGPPLVMLHGIGLDQRVWAPVLPFLEPEREAIAVDLPGFGGSAPLDGVPTIPAGFMPTLPEVGSRLPPQPVCPATIAWAEHDRPLLTARQAPRARRVYPRAKHRIVTGCGHVRMWDDPGLVATVLLEASEEGAPRAPGGSGGGG